MNRRLSASVVLAMMLVAILEASPVALARDGKPNVVFILADDLGRAEVGAYGQEKIKTPAIDRLAAEGMRFTRFYSGSPVCAPSRGTLMTGKHTGHGHVRDNREIQPEGQPPIPDAEFTLAEMFKRQGYATAAIGKWGLGFPGSEGDPLNQGFDHFFGYNCQRHAHNHYPTYLWNDRAKIDLAGNDGGATGAQHSHDLFEAEALRYVRAHKDAPFFLFLPFTIPHVALQVPEDSLAEYAGRFEETPYTGGRGYQPHPKPRAAYAAMVTRMDRTVGRILALLRETGIDDDTLVIFASDNGPNQEAGGADSGFFHSAGGLRGFKGSAYEGGIAVPMIVRWPGRVKPGATCDFVGYFPDVAPTLMELIGGGASLPPGLDGISFAPSLLGRPDAQPAHEFLYWEFASYGGWQAARIGPWKGVCRDLRQGNDAIELYNLDDDPRERRDLAADRPEIVDRIKAVMTKEHVRSEMFPLPTIDPK
ncbi:arylsulfatase [Planctomyces sp. SH-PL62]|uniref:arylsulfatase n=1 Tax=Planctomyces sp. SH-PL62 TaxID=1636152 RepID=UPI00078CDE05|nr:arylsulfatase [Planctomyces sp. SH-PL62]AMV36496.1 Arylsulfatase precursor [Planctomyces sp. SH-PL62]